MNFHIRLAGKVYQLAKERAGGTDELRLKIQEYVINYANGATAAQRGGSAVAGALTPEERRAKGQAAAAVRWAAVRDAAEKDAQP